MSRPGAVALTGIICTVIMGTVSAVLTITGGRMTDREAAINFLIMFCLLAVLRAVYRITGGDGALKVPHGSGS